MTKYEKIMQEMTPKKYAELLYKDHFKCYFCAYFGTARCGFNKPNICVEGIVEELNSEADLDEVDNNETV